MTAAIAHDEATLLPLETLQSALAYLMSTHNMITSQRQKGCAACYAIAIAQHLELLLEHPHLQSMLLRKTYQNLLQDWSDLTAYNEQQAAIKYQSKHQETLQIH